MPPTPLLSYSPSLPGTPISPAQLNTLPSVGDVEDTPRPRHAVAHSHPQAQTQAVVSPSRPRQRSEPSKRKKKKTEDDEEGNTPIGADDNAVTKSTGGNTPGCGRTLCKNCCIENAQRLVGARKIHFLYLQINSFFINVIFRNFRNYTRLRSIVMLQPATIATACLHLAPMLEEHTPQRLTPQ